MNRFQDMSIKKFRHGKIAAANQSRLLLSRGCRALIGWMLLPVLKMELDRWRLLALLEAAFTALYGSF